MIVANNLQESANPLISPNSASLDNKRAHATWRFIKITKTICKSYFESEDIIWAGKNEDKRRKELVDLSQSIID